jgi:hypothetical protein
MDKNSTIFIDIGRHLCILVAIIVLSICVYYKDPTNSLQPYLIPLAMVAAGYCIFGIYQEFKVYNLTMKNNVLTRKLGTLEYDDMIEESESCRKERDTYES